MKLQKNDELVLRTLHESTTPLTAYTLLDALRPSGITAPPTVYRALSRLVAGGLIHRVVGMNAYTTCHRTSHHHRPHQPVLLVCRHCHHTVELEEASVLHLLEDRMKENGFTPDTMTLEISGQCHACSVTAVKN